MGRSCGHNAFCYRVQAQGYSPVNDPINWPTAYRRSGDIDGPVLSVSSSCFDRNSQASIAPIGQTTVQDGVVPIHTQSHSLLGPNVQL